MRARIARHRRGLARRERSVLQGRFVRLARSVDGRRGGRVAERAELGLELAEVGVGGEQPLVERLGALDRGARRRPSSEHRGDRLARRSDAHARLGESSAHLGEARAPRRQVGVLDDVLGGADDLPGDRRPRIAPERSRRRGRGGVLGRLPGRVPLVGGRGRAVAARAANRPGRAADRARVVARARRGARLCAPRQREAREARERQRTPPRARSSRDGDAGGHGLRPAAWSARRSIRRRLRCECRWGAARRSCTSRSTPARSRRPGGSG